MATVRETIYWVDADDRIVRVSDSWDAFALNNDGGQTTAQHVIGRPLWRFIVGDTTRMWIQAVFQSTRLTGKSLERTYRCDSPREKRFMKMRIVPEANDGLRVIHQVVRCENIEPPIHFETATPVNVALTIRCSICNRLKTGEQWTEADQTVERPEAERSGRPIRVAYGICPTCKTEALPATSGIHH